MPFVSSTVPSTTAWMLAHCGFIDGITRTSANGETAPQWNLAVQAGLLGAVGLILQCLELTMLPILLGTELTLGPSSRARKSQLWPERFFFKMLGQPSH